MKYINPFKPIKITKVHFNIDTDRDGIFDYKDCRPFDYYKQHISQSIKQRVNKLKIYIIPHTTSDEVTGDVPHITQVPHKVESQMIYSVMKQFPHLLSKFEEVSRNADVFLYVGSSPYEDLQGQKTGQTQSFPTENGQLEYQVLVRFPFQVDTNAPFKSEDDDERWINKDLRATFARTIFHELVHIRQEQQDPKHFHKKYAAFQRKQVLPAQNFSRAVTLNPYEAQAYKEAQKNVHRRYDWPENEEQIYKGYRRIIK